MRYLHHPNSCIDHLFFSAADTVAAADIVVAVGYDDMRKLRLLRVYEDNKNGS